MLPAQSILKNMCFECLGFLVSIPGYQNCFKSMRGIMSKSIWNYVCVYFSTRKKERM